MRTLAELKRERRSDEPSAIVRLLLPLAPVMYLNVLLRAFSI